MGSESLEELSHPKRVREIKERHEKAMAAKRKRADQPPPRGSAWTRFSKTRTTISRAFFVIHEGCCITQSCCSWASFEAETAMLLTNFGMMDGRELWTDMLDEVPKNAGVYS